MTDQTESEIADQAESKVSDLEALARDFNVVAMHVVDLKNKCFKLELEEGQSDDLLNLAWLILHKSKKFAPQLAETRIHLGWVCNELKDFEFALAESAQASFLAPDNSEATWGLAVALYKLGNPQQALRLLDWMSKKEPDSLRPYAAMAEIYETLGSWKDVARMAELALERCGEEDFEIREMMQRCRAAADTADKLELLADV